MNKNLTDTSKTTCDHQPYFRKGLCRSCYERDLRQRNPEYAERQRENSRQWAAKHKEHLRQYNKEYRKRTQTPESNELKKLASHGLTLQDYQQMLDAQNGVCAICGREPGKNKLAIDHDHKTGIIRGLLCFRCNYGLGWFQDDLTRIYKAIAHLENKHVTISKLAPVKNHV